MAKNVAKINTRKESVAIMEKENAPKAQSLEKSQTEKFKEFISAETEKADFVAAEKIAKENLRKMQTELYAKLYAPVCENAIRNYFDGANAEEIDAEISAYNSDTKNGTILISPENPETFGENSVKNFSTENRLFFGYMFAPESAAKAARLVNYWIEYRRNIVDSLAAKVAANKATARKKAKAEKSATELLAEKYGVSVEQLNAILAANLAK